jgi:hypothetical protein
MEEQNEYFSDYDVSKYPDIFQVVSELKEIDSKNKSERC